jgi:DNA-binding response OmpR family regulator
MLPEQDFEIVEAKDGVEGLKLTHQEQPSLIMLDFLLPRLSGWEVFQELQKHVQLQTLPLVIMSGRKEEVTDKIQEPFEYFEFLEKPFEAKQLLEAIEVAKAKAKSREQPAGQAMPSEEVAQGVDAAEIAALNHRIAKMQSEIDGLKKAMSQIVMFVRQKLS